MNQAHLSKNAVDNWGTFLRGAEIIKGYYYDWINNSPCKTFETKISYGLCGGRKICLLGTIPESLYLDILNSLEDVQMYMNNEGLHEFNIFIKLPHLYFSLKLKHKKWRHSILNVLLSFNKTCKSGPLWSWSNGSWIHNYLCNQCPSLDFAHGEMYSIKHYVRKFVSNLRYVGDFLLLLRFPPPIKLTSTI